MKKHLRITVDGEEYEVIVEEVDRSQTDSPRPSEPEVKPASPRPTTQRTQQRPEPEQPVTPETTEKPEEPEETQPTDDRAPDKGDTPVEAPLAGTVKGIPVKIGDMVSAGDTVVLLEALKLENEITSPADGEVATIEVTEGTNVENGQVLMTIKSQ